MDKGLQTILSAYHRALWDGKKRDYLVIADSDKRARELWKTLLICVRPFRIRSLTPSRTVELMGGSTIRVLHRNEDLERLRGQRYSAVLFDEVRRCAK